MNADYDRRIRAFVNNEELDENLRELVNNLDYCGYVAQHEMEGLSPEDREAVIECLENGIQTLQKVAAIWDEENAA